MHDEMQQMASCLTIIVPHYITEIWNKDPLKSGPGISKMLICIGASLCRCCCQLSACNNLRHVCNAFKAICCTLQSVAWPYTSRAAESHICLRDLAYSLVASVRLWRNLICEINRSTSAVVTMSFTLFDGNAYRLKHTVGSWHHRNCASYNMTHDWSGSAVYSYSANVLIEFSLCCAGQLWFSKISQGHTAGGSNVQ